MNLYKSLIALTTAAVSLGAVADDEIMIVTLSDGTTVEYNVAQVSKVNFEIRETVPAAFTVTPADGETIEFQTIPTIFRQAPTDDSQPTMFGFGTVEAATPANLINGEYGVKLGVSAVKLYAGEFDLAENPDSYTLALGTYEDGKLIDLQDVVTAGTLSTKINNKTRKVTISLNATFKNGTVITAEYEGIPETTETIDEMFPEISRGNVLIYTSTSGNDSTYEVTGATVRTSTSYDTYTFANSGYEEFVIEIRNRDLINAGKLDLSEAAGFTIKYGYALQLGRRDATDTYSNAPNNGVMTFTKNDDGTYEISVDVVNKYNNYMGQNLGSGEHIIFHYAGEIK